MWNAPLIAFILLIVGFLDAWAGRGSYLGGDTVSYMDMAGGIAGGDFSYAVNGHFSSIYPVILALFIRPFQGSALVEFSVVRVVNFLIFAVTLGCFQVFLNRFLDSYYRKLECAGGSAPLLSRLQFTIVAYCVFAWGCFGLNLVSRINPDMCVAATTFAAAATLLAMADGQTSRVRFLCFGLILGIGYLFKAIFFPVSLLFLIAALLLPNVRAVKARLLLSLTVFLLVASPMVVALSVKAGHLNFGESGKLTYWWFVNGNMKEISDHWQGDPPGWGTPVHPVRKILTDPSVYEFGSPIRATYPPMYDPSYWNEGYKVRFNLQQQLSAIVRNLNKLGGFTRSVQSDPLAPRLSHDAFFMSLIISLFVVLIAGRRFGFLIASFRHFGPIWLVAIGIISIYLLVLLEARYVQAALSLVLLLSIASVLPPSRIAGRALGTLIVVLAFSGLIVRCGSRLAAASTLLIESHGDVRNARWLVAAEFERIGVASGTPVAAIASKDGVFWTEAVTSDWARLARVRVVSEVAADAEGRPQFWWMSPQRQAAALQALRQSGAVIVVANGVPTLADTAGWTRIGTSDLYYRRL